MYVKSIPSITGSLESLKTIQNEQPRAITVIEMASNLSDIQAPKPFYT